MGKKSQKFGGMEFIEEDDHEESEALDEEEPSDGFEELDEDEMGEEGLDEEGDEEYSQDEEGNEEENEAREEMESADDGQFNQANENGFVAEFDTEALERDGPNEISNEKKDIKDRLKKKLEELKGSKSLKDSLQEKRNRLLKKSVSMVKCREKRLKLLDKRQHEMQMIENKRRRELRKLNKANPANVMKPITIEDAREVGKSFLFNQQEEVDEAEAIDEFSALFSQEKTPKVLITTDEKPTRHIFEFIKELRELIPNSYYYPRKGFALNTICKISAERDFTHIMVVRERMKQPFQLVMICLPYGPSIVFRLSSVMLRQDLKFHGAPTGHKPELILKNFNTANGRRLGRFFGSMFDQDPEFKARTVVTFFNSRDFIFVRHHRYIYRENGTRCGLQEIGPRFTLKAKQILEGTFNKFARVEWLSRDDMYISRKAVYM